VSPSSLTRLVAVNITIARQDAGLTQTALAKRLGISTGTLNNWEWCRRRIGVAELVAVADALGVSVLVLLGRADEGGGWTAECCGEIEP